LWTVGGPTEDRNWIMAFYPENYCTRLNKSAVSVQSGAD
jgi:hypothetical protein